MDTLPTPLEYIFLLSAYDIKIKAIVMKAFEFFLHEPVLLLNDLKKYLIQYVHGLGIFNSILF